MKIYCSQFFFLLLIHLLCTSYLFSSIANAEQRLSVSPVTQHFKHVPVGKKYILPIPITVKNLSKLLTSYTIRARKPSQLGLTADNGFDEIPSHRWVTFEKKHIATNPNEVLQIKMFIEIPDKKEYLNKNWEFLVTVDEHFKPSSILNLTSNSKIFISTTPTSQ